MMVEQEPIIFGHKNLGIVEKIGSGGTDIKVGDRVAMPFNICCGHYRNCEEQYTGFYTNVNPGFAGGAYDYVGMRPYMEGQAEYLGVPYADFNVLKLSNTDNLHERFCFTYRFISYWMGRCCTVRFQTRRNNSNIWSYSSRVNSCLQC